MPLPGTGLIYEDPLFIDTDALDYSYNPISPCIDSGDPNESDPDGTQIDIGANYYLQTPDGDCNNDSHLDILDIVEIINNCILCTEPEDCGECYCGNLNTDDFVDVLDIILLLNILLFEEN